MTLSNLCSEGHTYLGIMQSIDPSSKTGQSGWSCSCQATCYSKNFPFPDTACATAFCLELLQTSHEEGVQFNVLEDSRAHMVQVSIMGITENNPGETIRLIRVVEATYLELSHVETPPSKRPSRWPWSLSR